MIQIQFSEEKSIPVQIDLKKKKDMVHKIFSYGP
jgi:hypothetical protein